MCLFITHTIVYLSRELLTCTHPYFRMTFCPNHKTFRSLKLGFMKKYFVSVMMCLFLGTRQTHIVLGKVGTKKRLWEPLVIFELRELNFHIQTSTGRGKLEHVTRIDQNVFIIFWRFSPTRLTLSIKSAWWFIHQSFQRVSTGLHRFSSSKFFSNEWIEFGIDLTKNNINDEQILTVITRLSASKSTCKLSSSCHHMHLGDLRSDIYLASQLACQHLQCGLSMTSWSMHNLFCFGRSKPFLLHQRGMDQPRRHWSTL